MSSLKHLLISAASTNAVTVASLQRTMLAAVVGHHRPITTQAPRRVSNKASIKKTNSLSPIVKGEPEHAVQYNVILPPQARSTNIDLDHESLLAKVNNISKIVGENAKLVHLSNPLTSSQDVIGSRVDVIELLLKARVPDNQIISFLPHATVALATTPLRDWEESIEYLKKYQFHPTQILPVLSACPELMVVNEGGNSRKLLFDVLIWLRSRGLGEGKMQAVISKNPAVLKGSLILLQRNHESLKQVVKLTVI